MIRKLRLVANIPDLRTVAALERLLSLAKGGHLTGFAYIAFHPVGDSTKCSADVLGEIADNTLVARGLCRELEDLVSK